MSKVYSGSAVPRHLLFVLADGAFVVQWDETRVQDLLSGRTRIYDSSEFGHPITDFELNQLKASGRVESFNKNYVWLYSLPEINRFSQALRTQEQTSNRVRSYYLNTGLPRSQMENIQNILDKLGLTGYFQVTERSGMVAIVGKDGNPFVRLKDAETVQKQLAAKVPEMFEDVTVAFIETAVDTQEIGRQFNSDTILDLDTIIAAQTDTTLTQGKTLVSACAQENEIQARYNLFLNQMKMRVQSVETAWEALHLIEDHSPDVLVMDLKLPDMHGWQMLGKLREIASLNPLLIIAVAEQDASSRDQMFALSVAKVDVYLVKPVSLQRLRHNVWVSLKQASY